MHVFWWSEMFGPIEPLFATLFLGFTTVLLFVWYGSRRHTHWKKLGVPYVKPYPVLGNILESRKRPLHEIEIERYRKYGRIYGYYGGKRPILSLAEPEILRSIMVKDFQTFPGSRKMVTGHTITDNMLSVLHGEDWKRVRTIVTPTFTTGKIKRMLGIFKDCSRTLVKNFREAANKGESVEAISIYGAFTMDVIASSSFSAKIDSHNDPNNEFAKKAREVFSFDIGWRLFGFVMFPWLMRFFRISFFSPSGMKFFSNATLQIIEERKRTGQTRNDFLQLLMDTAKEVSEEDKLDVSEKDDDITDNYDNEESNLIFKYIISKKTLSFEELVAQCVIFFLAGYGTTTSTLACASYLLALNLDVQEKLIREVDDVLQENQGELTYEAVQSMKYLDNIISETLRLYPPVLRLERAAEEEYTLPGAEITIRKGDIITIPIYAMHRDPKNFPDPEKFDPDRWLPEERAKRHQYCYMPFSAGPRNCIGMRFALMELKVCLAYVLSNFRIKKCSKTKVPLDFNISQILLQPKEIDVLFEIRKGAIQPL